mgnify:CR=1 FL=1
MDLKAKVNILYSIMGLYVLVIAYYLVIGIGWSGRQKLLELARWPTPVTVAFMILTVVTARYIIRYSRPRNDDERRIVTRLKQAILGGIIAFIIAFMGELGLWTAPFFFVVFILLSTQVDRIII